jgi:DNA-binding MarR family transcriptional regulator
MESVIGVPFVLANDGADAPAKPHNVVGLTDRRARLVETEAIWADDRQQTVDLTVDPLRAILDAAHALKEVLEDRLVALGGNLATWSILCALKNGDGQSQRSLAESCRIDAPTITRVLDRLEVQALVKRRRDVDDRRVVRVRLTTKGRLQYAQLAEVAKGLEVELSEALTACALEALVAIPGLLSRAAHPTSGHRR